jgi:hypothetical protein
MPRLSREIILRALKQATSEELGRELATRHKTGGARLGTGPKPQYVECPRCGEQVTKTQAVRGHGCTK